MDQYVAFDLTQRSEQNADLVIVVLAFILCGGLLFEVLKLFF